VLDQPVGLGLRLPVHRHHVAALVELELRLGRVDRERAGGLSPALERGGGIAGCRQRLRPRPARALAAREDAVDAVVVQPLVRADQRAVERRRDDLRPRELHLHGHGRAVEPGAQRARVAGERVRQHRRDRAGGVDAGGALARLAVQARIEPHMRGDVRDVDPHADARPLDHLGGDRVVEVLRARRIDRERGEVAQVAPRAALAHHALTRLGGFAFRRLGELAPQAALEQQRLDHLAGDVGAADPAQHLGGGAPARRRDQRDVALARAAAGVARGTDDEPARALAPVLGALARLEQGVSDEEAPAPAQHRDQRLARPGRAHPAFARSVSRAISSPCFSSTPFATFTSGVMPAPCLTPPPPRLRPFGVKYSPTVMSSAPPLDKGSSSWKTPLPNVCVPTTVARAWSCSAAVTISAADAVLASTSTTIGIEPGIAPPIASSVWEGWLRPRVETIVPFSMKSLAISCASETSPPPLPRRSSTIPWAPSCRTFSTASRTSPCAPGLKVASATMPSFLPLTVFTVEATTGSETV